MFQFTCDLTSLKSLVPTHVVIVWVGCLRGGSRPRVHLNRFVIPHHQGHLGGGGGRASSDGECRGSHSPSPSRKVDEDHQEEQSSIDFVAVVAQLRSLGRLPEAPSEERKIHGFMAALEDNDVHVTSLHKLPIGGASADILADFDSRVLSSSPGMPSRKSSKLLQYQSVRSRKFYRFQGEELTKAKALNRHIAELAGLRSFDSLNKSDIVWSSTEIEDMEAMARSIVEAIS